MTGTGKTVTRVDLCEAVYQKVGLSRTESSAFVELVLKEITDCLERGETVKLSSFGSFMCSPLIFLNQLPAPIAGDFHDEFLSHTLSSVRTTHRLNFRPPKITPQFLSNHAHLS